MAGANEGRCRNRIPRGGQGLRTDPVISRGLVYRLLLKAALIALIVAFAASRGIFF
jgi:hypothetical protein